jgi:hypothetical protein
MPLLPYIGGRDYPSAYPDMTKVTEKAIDYRSASLVGARSLIMSLTPPAGATVALVA